MLIFAFLTMAFAERKFLRITIDICFINFLCLKKISAIQKAVFVLLKLRREGFSGAIATEQTKINNVDFDARQKPFVLHST